MICLYIHAALNRVDGANKYRSCSLQGCMFMITRMKARILINIGISSQCGVLEYNINEKPTNLKHRLDSRP